MKNLTLFLARSSYKLGFWIFLSCYCSFAIAQKTSAVQYSKTDKTFANTTEIYKSKNATDVQILTEIEKDYGLGDIVRITDAPPPENKPSVMPLPQQEKIITATTPASLPRSSETVQINAKALPQNATEDKLSANTILAPTLLNIQPEKISDNALADKQIVAMTTEKKDETMVNRVENNRETMSSNRASGSSSGTRMAKTKSSGKKAWFPLFAKHSKPSKALYSKKKNKFGCYKF